MGVSCAGAQAYENGRNEMRNVRIRAFYGLVLTTDEIATRIVLREMK